MIVVTTDEIPGKRVLRTLGLVRGNSVRLCEATQALKR